MEVRISDNARKPGLSSKLETAVNGAPYKKNKVVPGPTAVLVSSARTMWGQGSVKTKRKKFTNTVAHSCCLSFVARLYMSLCPWIKADAVSVSEQTGVRLLRFCTVFEVTSCELFQGAEEPLHCHGAKV